MPDCSIVFLTASSEAVCDRLRKNLGDVRIVRNLDELRSATGDILLSFATSVIVPKDIIDRFFLGAYNVHAASPDYPGRDPHHFAVYDGATRYGATCHIMSARVDEGPIVDVEWFDVYPGEKPDSLLQRADAAALTIIRRVGPRLRSGERLLPNGDVWRGRKRRRSDFHRMCAISPDISISEFERRVHAFTTSSHANLTFVLHGKVFRMENEA